MYAITPQTSHVPTTTFTPTTTATATTTVSATPTPQPPTVITGDATVNCDDSNTCLVTLSGTVSANGLQTTAWFEYGKTSGSYGSTTATQTISGTSDTAISSEIKVTFTCYPETYYCRLVAQNSAGTSYGNENTFESLFYIIDCFGCNFYGRITDAATEKGIKDATILIDGVKRTVTDEEGYYDYSSYSDDYYNTCEGRKVTALASGYASSTGYGYEEECSCTTTLNFELQPATTPCTEIDSVGLSSKLIKLKRNESDVVTVMVLCNNGSPAEDVAVNVAINKAGKNRIAILPKRTSTDEVGLAIFTITAKNKTGNARITFKAGNVKKSMSVKVRRR